MAKRFTSDSSKTPTGRWICDVCGTNVMEQGNARGPGIWRDDAKVVHCNGRSAVWGARSDLVNVEHHYTRLHPPCKNCRAPMGCPRCSGPTYELLCVGCRAHPDALEKHGRLLKTPEERAEGLRRLRAIIESVSKKTHGYVKPGAFAPERGYYEGEEK